MYKNVNTNEIFDDYDAAREDMYETMKTAEIAEKFFELVTPEELLSWGLRDNNFWMRWENDIYDAEENWFDENYIEIEEDKEKNK